MERIDSNGVGQAVCGDRKEVPQPSLPAQVLLSAFAFTTAAWLLKMTETDPLFASVSVNGARNLMIPHYDSAAVGEWVMAMRFPAILLALQIAEVLRCWLSTRGWGLAAISIPLTVWCWFLELLLTAGVEDWGYWGTELEPSGKVLPRYALLFLVAGVLVVVFRKDSRNCTAAGASVELFEKKSLTGNPWKRQVLVSAILMLVTTMVMLAFKNLSGVWEIAKFESISIWLLVFVGFVSLCSIFYALWDVLGVQGGATRWNAGVAWLRGATLAGAFALAAEVSYVEVIDVTTVVVRLWIEDCYSFVVARPIVALFAGVIVVLLFIMSHGERFGRKRAWAAMLCASCAAAPWLYLAFREPEGSGDEKRSCAFFFFPILTAEEVESAGLRGAGEVLERRREGAGEKVGEPATPVHGFFQAGRVNTDTGWGVWRVFGDAVPRYLLAWVREKRVYVLLPDGRCQWEVVDQIEVAGVRGKAYQGRSAAGRERAEKARKKGLGEGVTFTEVLAPAAGPAGLLWYRGVEVVGLGQEEAVAEVVLRRGWRRDRFVIRLTGGVLGGG